MSEMCDVCGDTDPRVPKEWGFVREIRALICALCKAEYMRYLR